MAGSTCTEALRAVAVIGRDGPDPSRRRAWRDRHIPAIEAFAREGLLLLGLPLHSPQGRSEGALMIVAAADQAALDGYLAREPFAAGGVWQDITCRPLRIPSLPWRARPAVDAPLPPGRGHTILVLHGDAQPVLLADAAASGLLPFAAETLDAPGAILVTAHHDDAAALAFVAAGPVLRPCRAVPQATLFRPLAYRPLPQAAADGGWGQAPAARARIAAQLHRGTRLTRSVPHGRIATRRGKGLAMGYAIIAWDGPDPARRAAAREKHMAVLTRWAGDGRLALGMPLFTPDWRPAGSLMVLEVPDQAGLDAYLAEEPFAVDGVWDRWTVHPFRIAPLPYRPLPQPGDPVSATRTHTAIVAMDGTDADAPARRQAVRAQHMARVAPMAEHGVLAMGGAILDGSGAMRGSIAVTAHASDAQARAWLEEDPYVTGGVWTDIALHGTRFAGLPYRALPGAEG